MLSAGGYSGGELPAWGNGIEGWTGFMQYQGPSTTLAWAPQHTIPCWLGAALFWALKRRAWFFITTVCYSGPVWDSGRFFAGLGVALLIVGWLVLQPQYLRAVVALPLAAKQPASRPQAQSRPGAAPPRPQGVVASPQLPSRRFAAATVAPGRRGC